VIVPAADGAKLVVGRLDGLAAVAAGRHALKALDAGEFAAGAGVIRVEGKGCPGFLVGFLQAA
jgi:hypothetical protein